MTWLLLLVLCLPSQALGWGSRSHATICEASTFLLKNPELKKSLVPLGYMLGHICLIPDVDWKESKGRTTSGDSSHYFNPVNSGYDLKDVPLNYSQMMNKLTGKELQAKHKLIGSVWWRAEQFYRNAIDQGKKKKIPEMIVSLGLMGHFIGDNSNTFHLVDDYDGFGSGHGGIHNYFESSVPGVLGPTLVADIVAEAEKIERENPPFLEAKNFLLAMKEVALETARDKDFILKTDPILKQSSGNTPALRKDPETIVQLWKPVIIRSLARSALLQAKYMDSVFEFAGRPELKKHMKFPFRQSFVEPDYLK